MPRLRAAASCIVGRDACGIAPDSPSTVGRRNFSGMTTALDTYFETVARQLSELRATQREATGQAAGWVEQTLCSDRLIYAFGSGHSHALVEELFYRAGGLVGVVPIFDENLMLHRSATGSTEWERKEGYAETVLARHAIAPGDLLFVVSNSGRNAVPIEMALGGRQRGARVIAICQRAVLRRVSVPALVRKKAHGGGGSGDRQLRRGRRCVRGAS